MTLPDTLRTSISTLRDRYPQPRSAVIPALWAVQEAEGYITAERFADIADLLSITPSEVESVATFYSMFALKPRGKHFLLVCTNVSCALRGADDIADRLQARIGPSGATSADGTMTWERTVECLGACGYAPAMQLDHHFVEHLTPEEIDDLLEHTEKYLPAQKEGHHGATGPQEAHELHTESTSEKTEADPKKGRRRSSKR
ncbi:MAG: NADH-quinone oxidoreductase subunit NuoE [Candidatus Dormibacteria bacterium]